MNHKIKLISGSLIAALILSSCNSGGSSSSTNSYSKNHNISSGEESKSLFASIGGSVLEGFSEGFAFSPMGIGMTLGNLVTEWIFGEQEDTTTKTLVEINGKLDTILTNLQTELQLSNETSDVVNEFYRTYVGDTLTTSLKTFSDDISAINSKYSGYLTQNVFGSESLTVESSNLVNSMYQIALQNCKDTQIMEVLDANTTSTTSTTKSLNNISTEDKVDTAYQSFQTSYGRESGTYGSASSYGILKQSKENYIDALKSSSLPVNEDFMRYISKYNYENVSYAIKLAGSFQKLYNMQLAQLAYHYACNTNIRFNNLNLPDNESGLSGYLSAVKKMNETYDTVGTNLTANLKTYMAPLTNQELYTLVNTNLFASSNPFLGSSFNSDTGNNGDCALDKMVFNRLTSSSTPAVGIIKINASCIINKKDKTIESALISLEIPYASTTGYNVNRYGAESIGYDSVTKQIKYTQTNSDITMSSDDIYSLSHENGNEFATQYNNTDRWNTLVDSKFDYNSTGNNHYEWYPYEVSIESLELFKNRYYGNWNSGDSDQTDIMFDPATTSYTTNSIKASLNRHFDKYYRVTSEYEVKEIYLAMYNGKTFYVRIDSQHFNEDNYADSSSSGINGAIRQKIGLGCVTESCVRNDYTSSDNKTLLSWSDGTEVTLDGTLYSGTTPYYGVYTVSGSIK